MVSEKIRLWFYVLSSGLILFALIYWLLETVGVIHSLTDSLVNVLAGIGIFGFIVNINGELGKVKNRMDSFENTVQDLIESKFSKFERRFSSKMSKLSRELGKIEGRLDEISKK